MSELELYIKNHFGLLPVDEISTIASLFKKSTLKKGDYYLQTGKRCDRLGFVQAGYLRTYALKEDKEITQWISSKGYFSCDLASFIFESPSRWNIQALTDCELYQISKSDYQKIASLVKHWPSIEKLFLVRCFTILEDRIFSHLSMNADERYQQFFDFNSEMFNQVPLQYIASMLGMTAETFSRIRKKQIL